MYAAAFTVVVVPLLGQIASRIRSPTKTSQGGSYEDKPIWTTWIENVVQAFAGRRPDDEFERNRHGDHVDPDVGNSKEGASSQPQPPMHSQSQSQPVFPSPTQNQILSGLSDLETRRLLIERATSRQSPQYDTHGDIWNLLQNYFHREKTAYPQHQPINQYPPPLDDRALPRDPWNGSNRNRSQSGEMDPELTELRRVPQANEPQQRSRQAYDALSPVQRDTRSERDHRDRPDNRQRGLKPDELDAARPRQDYLDQPLQSSGRNIATRGGGQADEYLNGEFHSRGRAPEGNRARPSPEQDRAWEGPSSRRSDAGRTYNNTHVRSTEKGASYDARYSDQGRNRDRGRSSYDDDYDERRDRSPKRRGRDGYGQEDYESLSRGERKERRKRNRRQRRDGRLEDRSLDREHRDRHRYHSPERSDDNKDHNSRGGNNTNVVVNVGVAPTETPAVKASRAITPPPQDLPIIRDVIPIAEVKPVHDPLVDPGEAQQAQRHEAARVRQERYQAAMRGPPSRKASLETSQATDVEPANGDNPTPIPEKERAIEINTSPLNAAAPIPPVNVGRDESIESESVREPGTDHQTLETSKVEVPPPELESDTKIPLTNISDSARSSGTAHTLRDPGKKRKPELSSIETHTQETAEPSSVKRDSVLQTSPAKPEHPAQQTTPKDWEASPNVPSPEAHKDVRQPNLRSPLDQGQGSEPTSPASTSQHRSRRFRGSSNSIRHQLESQDLSASDSGRPISSLHSASFPRSAARQSQSSEQRGDSDTETLSINEPARTVADRVSQTKPGRPRGRRRRQRVAREVLEYSSTLKAHNVRGPKSLARLIKLALKSSPKVTFIMVVVWVTYVAGIVYFGNQVTALEQLTSTSVQPVRRGPEDEIAASSTFSPLESFERDTQLLIILNLWHASIWLILLLLIDYIWRSIPDPNQDQRHQVWFNRLGFKSLARIALTFAPMAVYLFLGGRQLTSCAYLLNDPQAIAWSMWPDVALTWPQLSEAAITRTTATSAIGTGKDDVDGMQLLAVSAFFWGTGIPAFLYTIRRIRYPGLRSKRRLISKIRKESLV